MSTNRDSSFDPTCDGVTEFGDSGAVVMVFALYPTDGSKKNGQFGSSPSWRQRGCQTGRSESREWLWLPAAASSRFARAKHPSEPKNHAQP